MPRPTAMAEERQTRCEEKNPTPESAPEELIYGAAQFNELRYPPPEGPP